MKPVRRRHLTSQWRHAKQRRVPDIFPGASLGARGGGGPPPRVQPHTETEAHTSASETSSCHFQTSYFPDVDFPIRGCGSPSCSTAVWMSSAAQRRYTALGLIGMYEYNEPRGTSCRYSRSCLVPYPTKRGKQKTGASFRSSSV